MLITRTALHSVLLFVGHFHDLVRKGFVVRRRPCPRRDKVECFCWSILSFVRKPHSILFYTIIIEPRDIFEALVGRRSCKASQMHTGAETEWPRSRVASCSDQRLIRFSPYHLKGAESRIVVLSCVILTHSRENRRPKYVE